MNDKFINPYTFIPLDRNEPQRGAQDNSGKDTLSGFIDISVRIREDSPLFIPNTTKSFEEDVVVYGKKGSLPKKEEHFRKVFYSYRDLSGEEELTDGLRRPEQPVIPGSELRGMVRNVYEQLTNSCYPVIDENNLPYKRTNEPKLPCIMKWSQEKNCWMIYPDIRKGTDYFKGALLKNSAGEWFLQEDGWLAMEKWETIKAQETGDRERKQLGRKEIQRLRTEVSDNFRNGDPVRFQTKNRILKWDRNGEYILRIPSWMDGNKQNVREKDKDKKDGQQPDDRPTSNQCIVYTANHLNDADGIPLSMEDERTRAAMERFEHVLGTGDKTIKGGYLTDVNQNRDANKVYSQFEKMYKNHKPLFVYADKDSVDSRFQNGVIYLAPAAMSKEFFSNTIETLLEKDRKHQPCSGKDSLCPACRLFGMIGDDGAAAGKLRFADTHAAEGIDYGKETTLDILSSPRISSTEFYLRKPEDGSGRNAQIWNYDYYITTTKGENKETDYHRFSYEPELAGRKVYWNRRFREGNADKRNMNISVTPLISGTFRSRIYFDRISREELENLLFCLEPAGHDAAYYHKLGAGKPLGLGQVKVRAENVVCTRYCVENGTILKKSEPYQRDAKRAAEISRQETAALIRRYGTDLPEQDKALIDYPRENGDIFKWFGQNRGTVTDPKIIYTLPRITEERQTLPAWHGKKQPQNGDRQNRGWQNFGERNNGGFRPNGYYGNNRNQNGTGTKKKP